MTEIDGSQLSIKLDENLRKPLFRVTEIFYFIGLTVHESL